MASVTPTSVDAILKRFHSPAKVRELAYKRNPLLALMPKSNRFPGESMKVPVVVEDVQGASRTFSNAQTNKTAGTEEHFLISRVKDYSLVSIELEAIQASQDNVGAWMQVASMKIKSAINTAANNLGMSLYRSTSGSRGQVGSTSTTTLTLKEITDVVNFAVGMTIDSDDVDGGGTVDGDATAITGIDRVAGTLTAAGNWTGSSNFSNDDYLFRDGDYDASCSGLVSYLDSAAAALHGMTRTGDATRLAGVHYTGTSDTIAEALQRGESLLSREGGKASHCFLNHDDHRDLRLSLGSKVEYDVAKSPDMASVGFKTIVLQGSEGPIKVVADRHCPKGVAYMLQLDTWKWCSIGDSPKILQGLGNKFIWDSSADSIEVRCGYYGNLACYAPGWNARITLPS